MAKFLSSAGIKRASKTIVVPALYGGLDILTEKFDETNQFTRTFGPVKNYTDAQRLSVFGVSAYLTMTGGRKAAIGEKLLAASTPLVTKTLWNWIQSMRTPSGPARRGVSRTAVSSSARPSNLSIGPNITAGPNVF